MKELIEKAEQLGFDRTLPEFHYDTEEYYYINLCLIQKWLRDEKGVDVEIIKGIDKTFAYILNLTIKEWFKTYEQALEEGIKHALKELGL